MQVYSDDAHRENAAISRSEGSQYKTGTKLAAEDFIDAESYDEEEALEESEFADGNEISAAVSKLSKSNLDFVNFIVN